MYYIYIYNILIYVFVCVYIYICLCVCIYIYIYIYIYDHMIISRLGLRMRNVSDKSSRECQNTFYVQ